jgi:hypothetical protein
MEWVHGYPASHWTPPSGDYSLFIAPAAARGCMQHKNNEKCMMFAGHFNGHGNAPVQYQAHCPMKWDQGYSGSHWSMPPGEHCDL